MGEKQAEKEETIGGRDRPYFWTFALELLPAGIHRTAKKNAHKGIVSNRVCMYGRGGGCVRVYPAASFPPFASADIVASRPRVELQECGQGDVDIPAPGSSPWPSSFLFHAKPHHNSPSAPRASTE